MNLTNLSNRWANYTDDNIRLEYRKIYDAIHTLKELGIQTEQEFHSQHKQLNKIVTPFLRGGRR